MLSTASGAEAISLAARGEVDLIVLNLGLPDIPGEEAIREVRRSSDVPVLMLTAKSGQADRIRGLELGADDYVTKPFSPREAVLRAQAILRRGREGKAPEAPASYGGGLLLIDHSPRAVTVRASEERHTPTEWALLTALARVPGLPRSRPILALRRSSRPSSEAGTRLGLARDR
ncbi:MAG: response regulator transcription factor [Acidimicrobiales bacterium]